MPDPAAPLLFPETLNFPGQRKALGQTHKLNGKDFDWLAHVKLATQALRNKQSPSMVAQKIRIAAGPATAITLAGSFILTETPDDKGAILYTPYDGIKKYDSLATLKTLLEKRLQDADEQDQTLAFLSLAQRRQVVEQGSVTLTYETIDGDVFEHQQAAILACQQLNAEAMLAELKQLPSLTSLVEAILDDLLKADFPHIKQAQTRVNFYTDAPIKDSVPAAARHWHDSTSLSDAVLTLYRHQRWPIDQLHEFSNPRHTPFAGDQAIWENALQQASGKLKILLFGEMERFWDDPARTGASRREFFGEALEDQARAELMLKREAGVIDASQFAILHQMIRPAALPTRRPTIETVRLWEYEPNFVELAGSLMISQTDVCLYTPTMGLQVLADYNDLKRTVLSKFRAPGHEDELYGLLDLEERKRFIGFDRPQVTGESVGGEIFKVLFEAIITKQRQSIEYALQVFRHSDGAVDIHAMFDKALDIRAMIHERLLELDAGERWTTRPVLAGVQQPSEVRVQKAAAVARTCEEIEPLLTSSFKVQPVTRVDAQRSYLENMKSRLAHSLFVGVTGEAALRVLSGSLKAAEQMIVDTVFHSDQPCRDNRRSLNGFRPDAWSITLDTPGGQDSSTLAHCVLLTERGGLDDLHSGKVIVWTPALGLEAFNSIAVARLALNQRLKDSAGRLSLLENLLPQERRFHQQYTLGALRLIEDNVLHNLVQSGIEHFIARCDELRQRFKGRSGLTSALATLTNTAIDTNLLRTIHLAKAINQQQALPAWLGMAPIGEQQIHLELLEQWRHSVVDHKDYLSGMPSLDDYVNRTLKSLLDTRFKDSKLEPQDIEITPNLALAGPARPLTEFALNHINIAQGTGFTVASKTLKQLPDGLEQATVRQLLLSLDIPTTFAKSITDALTDGHPEAKERKQRFIRQIPWQLLQHAHGLKLQQQLSGSAFDYLCQVLDIPDGIARTTVEGAHALVYPLSLVKTAGAAAVEALGVYVIGPGSGHTGPRVVYVPYAEQLLREFADEASLIAAVNTPGTFQDLVIRRLPQTQQSVFRGLLRSSAGQVSEMTLSGNTITGNLLHRFFSDNLKLLPQLLSCQSKSTAQADWDAAKKLFSHGASLISGLLPGKLSYVTFLWQAYKDFKDSAENLQDHHWTQALKSFIAGGLQMITLGRLAIEDSAATQASSETPAQTTAEIPSPPPIRPEGSSDVADTTTNPPEVVAPTWSQIRTTSPLRTELQPFETSAVALEDLKRDTKNGTYEDPTSKHTYTAIAGKVHRVEQPGAVWQIVNDQQPGPSLRLTGSRLLLAPDRHAVHYGKAISKLHKRYAVEMDRRTMLNIEAIGMAQIRRDHPQKAQVIQHAVDLARFYAFNCLHNLAQLKANVPGTRLDGFLRVFFGVTQVDTGLLRKLNQAIVPICQALVDPDDDLMNTDRFVVGSNTFFSSIIAFVLSNDDRKMVHFTENFFNQQLDSYKSILGQPFDIDGHAQAAILIHEFAHQYSKAEDFATLESRRPFHDLITTFTLYGLAMKHELETFQAQALSLATPRDELFARWSKKKGSYVSLDKIPGAEDLSKSILTLTSSPTMNEARNAFLDQNSADVRIDVILRNADSIARLICEMGRQLDPVPQP
ncbi:dermonecrotic toxin domain-containing protein [Pseudomonas sp. NPDC087639]|uniref:dermonecrotic toxin domain-containing protein n=1 Tax=Pseudomonas sp. NPDC087639 TaxID=3364445 RepID=UPI00380D25B5